MISNSPRVKNTRYELEQRKSFALGVHFTLKDKKTPLDVTGCVLTLTVKAPRRLGGAVEILETATILNGPLGLFQFELMAEDLDLNAADYDFAMTLKTALGYTVLVQKGVFSMQPNVDTAGLDDSYLGVNPSTNIAVSVEKNNILEVHVTSVDGLSILVQALIDGFTTDVLAALAANTAAMENLLDFDAVSILERLTDLENNTVTSSNIRQLLRVTQAGYDAIGVKDPNTLYVVVG